VDRNSNLAALILLILGILGISWEQLQSIVAEAQATPSVTATVQNNPDQPTVQVQLPAVTSTPPVTGNSGVTGASPTATLQSAGSASAIRRLGVWEQVTDMGMTGNAFGQSLLNSKAGYKVVAFMVNENFSSEVAQIDGAATELDGSAVQVMVMWTIDPTAIMSGSPITLAMVESAMNQLASHKSIIAYGIEGERSENMTNEIYAEIGSLAVSLGKRFINYYTPSSITLPSYGVNLVHSNYPYQDPVTTLSLAQSGNAIGMDFGYDANFVDPLWTQAVIDNILRVRGAVALPFGSYVLFDYILPFDPGFEAMVSGSQYRNLFM